ncbi:hypothetical protein [Paenibacillus sp. MMS18-CY102]|uniref:hypothetical protein n=1 Tax=Paenibacillus sp. MMS18-CY102 TaxID=2682849 RepID=UPI001366379D|nr:hypothetical protein [Paenibacillus sp. MMS18-CY102]MWC29491.1 hypothetical protein [Paenibacillus sp. MMS18-CY102]
MDCELKRIEEEIERLATEIIVPLRGKEINETAFQRLFQLVGLLIISIEDNEYVLRKTAGLLFFIYSQLETQESYATGSQVEQIRKKKAKLLTLLRKFFGDVHRQNT